jgi:hypothetical protein
LEQLAGFGGRHVGNMAGRFARVTRENSQPQS